MIQSLGTGPFEKFLKYVCMPCLCLLSLRPNAENPKIMNTKRILLLWGMLVGSLITLMRIMRSPQKICISSYSRFMPFDFCPLHIACQNRLSDIGVLKMGFQPLEELKSEDELFDIHAYFKKAEERALVDSSYMEKHLSLNEGTRTLLMDWIVEVHGNFVFAPETLFLAASMIDRYFAAQLTCKEDVNLVGSAALMVAAKYEEEFTFYDPRFKVFMAEQTFTLKQLCAAERLVLKGVDYKLTLPTGFTFLKEYMKGISADEAPFDHLAQFLLELCLMEYSMLKYRPSHLAAAAMYTALCTFRTCHTPTLIHILKQKCGYHENELKKVAIKMVNFHMKTRRNIFTAIYNKYSRAEYHNVVALPIAYVTRAEYHNMVALQSPINAVADSNDIPRLWSSPQA